MVPSPAISISIRKPPLVTDMKTHLQTYRKTVSNQINLISGLKVTADQRILVDKYLNTHENL